MSHIYPFPLSSCEGTQFTDSNNEGGRTIVNSRAKLEPRKAKSEAKSLGSAANQDIRSSQRGNSI